MLTLKASSRLGGPQGFPPGFHSLRKFLGKLLHHFGGCLDRFRSFEDVLQYVKQRRHLFQRKREDDQRALAALAGGQCDRAVLAQGLMKPLQESRFIGRYGLTGMSLELLDGF